jgi:hypothetical protein
MYTAKDFGYDGWEMLMNPETGSVDMAKNWALECHQWADTTTEIAEQFFSLIEVTKVNGEWIEI